VTSSGLTHSCLTPFWGGVCPYILNIFQSHRDHVSDPSVANDSHEKESSSISSFPHRNYGSIAIDWTGGEIKVNIHDTTTAQESLTFNRPLTKSLHHAIVDTHTESNGHQTPEDAVNPVSSHRADGPVERIIWTDLTCLGFDRGLGCDIATYELTFASSSIEMRVLALLLMMLLLMCTTRKCVDCIFLGKEFRISVTSSCERINLRKLN